MLSRLRFADSLDHWRNALACAIGLGLGTVALVLLWRKLAGAFTAPASPGLAWTVTFASAVLGLAAARLFARREAHASEVVTDRGPAPPGDPHSPGFRSDGRPQPPFPRNLAAWYRAVPAAAVMAPVVGIALTLTPADSTAAIAGVTAVVLLAAAAFFLAPAAFGLTAQAGGEGAPATGPPPDDAVPAPCRIWPEEAAPSAASGQFVSEADETQPRQWMTRSTGPEGEQIEGGLHVEFAPGERQAVAHLAFCPPLSESPILRCEPVAGCSARVKVAAVYPWGARIELRRSGTADTAETVQVQFAAVVAAVSAA